MKKKVCYYCKYGTDKVVLSDMNDVVRCENIGPFGYICTRPKGHKGKHVGCGLETHILHSWE